MDILDKIKAYKLEEVAARKAAVPLSEVEERAAAASSPRGFAKKLTEATKSGYGLIAEIKKAREPSRDLPELNLVFPYLIPIMAERGSDMARIRMEIIAMCLGKLKMHKRIAIR